MRQILDSPSAAHPQGAPALVKYHLRCAVSGRVGEFDAIPVPLDIQNALTDLFLFGHPSDVTARALAEAVVERPGEVARYGETWELVRLGGDVIASPLVRAADLLEDADPDLAHELRALLAPQKAKEGFLYAHPIKPGVTGLVTRLWHWGRKQEEWVEVLWSDRMISDHSQQAISSFVRLDALSPHQAQEWERRVMWREK